MSIWAYSCSKDSQFGGYYDLNAEISKSIETLAKAQFEMEKVPMLDFSNTTHNVLTCTPKDEDFIIQDIFYFVMPIIFTEDWERSLSIRDLKNIIKLSENLAITAIDKGADGGGSFICALYEVGYFILRGLPDSFKLTEKDNDLQALYPTIRTSNQEILEEELFNTWRKLFPLFYKYKGYLGLEWEQSFFGILGIGCILYHKWGEGKLRSQLIKCTNQLRQIIICDNINSDHNVLDKWWDYLQLLGVWVYYLLNDKSLGEEISKDVAKGRSFSCELYGHSSRGKYGYLGYTVILHQDFFLPWLRNLQKQNYLGEKEWDKFRSWQETIMNPDILIGYYKIIEKTRDPLRKQFYERISNDKKKENTK